MCTFSSFQEEDIVAGMKFGEGIEGFVVIFGGFGVKLRVSMGMRKEGMQVVEEMAMSVTPAVSKSQRIRVRCDYR